MQHRHILLPFAKLIADINLCSCLRLPSTFWSSLSSWTTHGPESRYIPLIGWHVSIVTNCIYYYVVLCWSIKIEAEKYQTWGWMRIFDVESRTIDLLCSTKHVYSPFHTFCIICAPENNFEDWSVSQQWPCQIRSHWIPLGKILSVSDLLLIAPNEVAKQCKITLTEAQSIIDIVCKQSTHQSRCLTDADVDGDEIFTTGDRELDDALGGGIRTSMVWEVVGQR